jgi:hypothetical protein
VRLTTWRLPGRQPSRKAIWREFRSGRARLEFALAADIVRSVITPTWLEIGQLGAIAVIRTFSTTSRKGSERASKEPTSGMATASEVGNNAVRCAG